MAPLDAETVAAAMAERDSRVTRLTRLTAGSLLPALGSVMAAGASSHSLTVSTAASGDGSRLAAASETVVAAVDQLFVLIAELRRDVILEAAATPGGLAR